MTEPLRYLNEPVNDLSSAESNEVDNNNNNTTTDLPGNYWSQESCNIPLESDSYLLEYFSKHNYDVDSAWFCFCVDICRGKGKIYFSNFNMI